MDKLHFKAFHGQLGRECTFALKAVDGMKKALRKRELPINQQQPLKEIVDDFYYSVDAFLVATANVSKCFFESVGKGHPDRKRNEIRCAELRAVFGIKKDSMFNNRDIRNAFEHFDLQIDKWHYCSVHHDVVDSNIVPITVLTGFQLTDTLRNFDPETWTLYFTGKELQLEPLVSAVNELVSKLKQITPENFQVPRLDSETKSEENPTT